MLPPGERPTIGSTCDASWNNKSLFVTMELEPGPGELSLARGSLRIVNGPLEELPECPCNRGYPYFATVLTSCIVCQLENQNLSLAGPCAQCDVCKATRQFICDTDANWKFLGYEETQGPHYEIWQCQECMYGVSSQSIFPGAQGILTREVATEICRKLHALVCPDLKTGRLSC